MQEITMHKSEWEIINVLNNSAMIVKNEHKEMVVFKQGIAFGKKKGERVLLDHDIEKKFECHVPVGQFNNVVNGYPEHIVDAVSIAVGILQAQISQSINQESLLAFIDHLAACFGRIEKNMDIENFFYYETKILYPKAYDIATQLAIGIQQQTTFIIPETEVAYLALHIQNIEGNMPRQLMDSLNAIVFLIDEMLSHDYQMTMDKESYAYSRFLIHLKLLIKHVYDRITQTKIDLSEMVEKKYPYEYGIALKIKAIIEQELDFHLSDDESAYIAIHLLNVSSDVLSKEQ